MPPFLYQPLHTNIVSCNNNQLTIIMEEAITMAAMGKEEEVADATLPADLKTIPLSHQAIQQLFLWI